MMRAIIIGSGIGGLSTALAFRRVGIDVTVYERASELTEIGAGISLWANALRALDAIGVGGAVREKALRLVRSEIRVRSGHRVAVSFPAEPLEKRVGYTPLVAMIHRAELVATLAACLPADVARYGFECVGVELRGDRVGVQFHNGQTDEADVVIGADGIHSAVRSALFGRSEPRYSGYTCWRGICARPTSIEAGYVGEWWGRGQRFGITTLTNDRIYWFATKNAPPGGHNPDERQFVAEAFRGWAEPIPELIASTPADRFLRNDIVDRPPDPRWVSGRAVLVGDAAHPTTPNLGQGGCLAIEDAVVLARHLSRGGEPGGNLEAFARERYPRTSSVTNASWRFGGIGQWQGRIACWVRDGLFRMLLPRVGPGGMLGYVGFDVGTLPTK